jgi:DNA-binding MarR family transcriptional regulator
VFIAKTISLSTSEASYKNEFLMEGSMDSFRTNGTRATATAQHATELLELFYPIHYQGTMAVEDAMRGELTRKQAAILWLIRSAGTENGRCIRRKEIVMRLQDWFDVSSPAITQALRRMARPPLGLVRLVEDSDSGREKRVLLTPKGERFISTMTGVIVQCCGSGGMIRRLP